MRMKIIRHPVHKMQVLVIHVFIISHGNFENHHTSGCPLLTDNTKLIIPSCQFSSNGTLKYETYPRLWSNSPPDCIQEVSIHKCAVFGVIWNIPQEDPISHKTDECWLGIAVQRPVTLATRWWIGTEETNQHERHVGPPLLTWFNFNRSMDNE